MKKKIKPVCCAIIALCLFSCGNKTASTTEEETKENVEVIVPEPEPEKAVAEEMVLSLTRAEDPCFGNSPDYLHIKGGKPFEDNVKPYKVEAENTKKGSMELGKFVKKDDGSFTMEIPGTVNLADDEVTIKVTVTDADGTIKTIDYVIPYCP